MNLVPVGFLRESGSLSKPIMAQASACSKTKFIDSCCSPELILDSLRHLIGLIGQHVGVFGHSAVTEKCRVGVVNSYAHRPRHQERYAKNFIKVPVKQTHKAKILRIAKSWTRESCRKAHKSIYNCEMSDLRATP